MSDVPARTIGPYRLESLIGRGGMGEVYKAYQPRLERWVAIKHIRSDAAERPETLTRFRREARLMAHLSHPAVVQVFDLLEEDDGDWIVMELLGGSTVAQLLRQGPLAIELALAYGQQVAEALAEAHAQGIIHRDLKAENVIITVSGHAKVVDFGLAKRLLKDEVDGSISIEGQVLGTGRAMSPEQARGYEVDPRSDLFSLGTFLYEMLTGVSPFRGDTVLVTMTRVSVHQQTPARLLRPEIPPELSELIDCLLEKAPELRPASAREVAGALEQIRFAFSAPTRVETAGVETAVLSEETRFDRAALNKGSPAPAAGTPSSPLAALRIRWRLVGGLVAAALVAAIGLVALNPETRQSLQDWLKPRPAALSPHELYEQGMALLVQYHQQGNTDQAIASFQRMLAHNEDSAPAHAGLAQAYLYHNLAGGRDPALLDQALAAAERAVALDEHLAVARVSRGLVYSQHGRYEEAIRDFQEALHLDPDRADAYRGLGEVYRLRKQYQQAEDSFHKAIGSSPNDPRLYGHLGWLYYDMARWEDAEAVFRKSIEVAPDNTMGYRNLARVCEIQGRLVEAAALIQKGLEIQAVPYLYRSLGSLYHQQGLYQKSASAFKKVLDLGDSNNYLNWANLGDAYRQLPDHEAQAGDAYLRAIQLIEKKLELTPQDANLRSRLALFRAKRGDRKETLAELESLDASSITEHYPLFRAAVAYEICGQRDNALRKLELALRAGFPLAEVRSDPELLELRGDPRYHQLEMAMEVDNGNP